MASTAGERDRRLTILRRTLTYDAHYQPTETFVQLSEVWASWRRATANERIAAGQVSADVTDIFEILWSPALAALDATHRLRFAGRDYDVTEVTEIGFHEGLLIRAAARAD